MSHTADNSKKRSRIIFLGAMAFIICVNFVAYMTIRTKTDGLGSSQYPICRTSGYHSVGTGMNKDGVTKLLGEPQSKRIKTSSDQNFFSQGENEAKIYEGWIYHINGKSGSAEIYFDSSGRVNGKGCGVG